MSKYIMEQGCLSKKWYVTKNNNMAPVFKGTKKECLDFINKQKQTKKH